MSHSTSFITWFGWIALALGVGVFLLLVIVGGRPNGQRNGASLPLTVLASGDTTGWIVPCGCTSNQSGGLPRRGTYVAGLAATHQVLLVDAGGAAADNSAYDRAKLEAILAGELAMGLVAHNIGAAEA